MRLLLYRFPMLHEGMKRLGLGNGILTAKQVQQDSCPSKKQGGERGVRKLLDPVGPDPFDHLIVLVNQWRVAHFGLRLRMTGCPFTGDIPMRPVALAIIFSIPLAPLAFPHAAAHEEAWVQHTYEVKFRLKGIVSTTQVQANDAAQAKKLAEAQYGKEITVLSTKRLK